MIAVPYAGKTVDVPVHIYSKTGDHASAPVLLTSGGVDTYKLDFHASYVTQAQVTGATIIAFDMPGTAELRQVPLRGPADEVVLVSSRRPRRSGTARSATARFRSAGTSPRSLG